MATSIADLALQIIDKDITDIRKGKKAPPNTNSLVQAKPEPAGLDISETKVSNSMMGNILEQSFGIKPKREVANITTPTIVKTPPLNLPETNLNEAIQQLDDTINYLVALRGTLNEMTTAGMMGVNFAGPQKDCGSDDEEEKKPKAKSKAKGKLKLKFGKK